MIGQKQVLKQIDNLIEKGFPRFVIITGQKGQGKTELVKYISKKLKYSLVEFGIKIDEIREMIEIAYKQTEPIIYLIQNADKMSINAQNSLLKLVEEPPQQAFIIMELQQIENTLETIKSRCQEIKVEMYSELEIEEMINIIKSVSTEEKNIIKKVAENYYQIEKLIEYNPLDFLTYVDKVYRNIYKVQSANSFKIGEKLDLKDTGEGYSLDLFWNMYVYISWKNMTEDNLRDWHIIAGCIYITAKFIQKLNINGINKNSLFDIWILSIRKEWLK